MTTPAPPAPIVLGYDEDPLGWLAQTLAGRVADTGPDLHDVVVLLPDLQHAPRLRRLLHGQARGCTALLGPRIHTLRGFIDSLPLDAPEALSPDARELVLVAALRGHEGLFGGADPWRLAEALLELFTELARQQTALPGTEAALAAMLRRGYGVDGPPPAHLGQEAGLVHTLWRAWQTQLQALGYVDPEQAFALRLERSLAALADGARVYLIGCTEATPAEAHWIRTLQARGQLTLVLHGTLDGAGHGPHEALAALARRLALPAPAPAPAPAPYGAFVDAAFDWQAAPLRERARRFAQAHPHNPVQGRLAVFRADDGEHEARAVELQVRRWLLDGAASIGIVTEDRRLARRIRALLERAGVALQDSGGWAVSTTSAAATVERWLQAVEEDFAHRPLLDLLKSPFLVPGDDAQAARYRQAVYRFERDIVRHENVARGLDRYRAHLHYRRRRLEWPRRTAALVEALLTRLEQAAASLGALRGGRAPLHAFADALLASLEQLGLRRGLEADGAGAQVLERIGRLRTAAQRHPLTCDWREFRGWLGAQLERAHFRPVASPSPVQLLGLGQSRLGRFDALVIAGAERELLPGHAATSPFFNDAVRQELGLPTWREALALRWHHLRRLLEAAPRVLLTLRAEQDGEEVLPCPWVEALESFHLAAYGHPLTEPRLAALLADPRSQVQAADPGLAPPPTRRPRPRLPAPLVPRTLSAGAHQRLIDCPYLFFGADGLRLKPLEEIREALEKSDYGQRVHRCLEAFHGGVEGLPGPFPGVLGPGGRGAAIALLEAIARAEFAKDLEDNFLHRGWLRRWLRLIPAYVDWEIARQTQWRPQRLEQDQARALTGGWQLRGRLDRIDADPQGRHAILDYKTGRVPRDEAVQAGEAVQLISYGLLQPAVRLEYLLLDAVPVKAVGATDAEEIAGLCTQVQERLEAVLEAIAAGAPLPAWGDPEVCAHCELPGVCRRAAWAGEDGDG